MNITPLVAESILRKYDIHSAVSDLHFFINYHCETDIKVIFRIDFQDRLPVVIKLVNQEEHPHIDIENQSAFSEHLRRRGISTPKRYMSGSEYCISDIYDDTRVDVTVEDWCGSALLTLDFDTAEKAGMLMAEMHYISLRDNCSIGAGTSFNAIGYNAVSGYPKFCVLKENYNLDQGLCHKIISLYEKRIKRIKSVWETLPKCAVQGDIRIDNLTYVENVLTVFDYNNAGDAVLVGDMTVEGLFIANEMELPEGLSDFDRPELFRRFVQGYIDKRPLSDEELSVMGDIYSVCNTLWLSKIQNNSDSLEMLIERNEYKKANSLLSKILDSFNDNWIPAIKL